MENVAVLRLSDLLYLYWLSLTFLTFRPTHLVTSFDLLYLHFGVDFAFVRVNRLLRVGRMLEFFDHAESSFFDLSLEFFDRTDSRTNYPHIFRVLQLVIYMIFSLSYILYLCLHPLTFGF